MAPGWLPGSPAPSIPVPRTPAPSWLAGRLRPHETTQHLADLDGAGAGRHHRIVRGECPQLLFVVGLHHAKAPRAGAVKHGTEDHHLARLDPGPPMGSMAGHDLPFLVVHVQRERRTGRFETEYERAHEPRIPVPRRHPIPARLAPWLTRGLEWPGHC